MPSPYVTSLVFGGPNRDILFATSTKQAIDISNGTVTSRAEAQPNGDLFMITGLHTKGIPVYKPRL